MAEKQRDLYEILGVPRGADADVLRKAYRKLARKFHPDVNPGDKKSEERFKELSRAYDTLSDPEKRRAYDEFGEISLQAGFDAEAARRAQQGFGQRFGGGGPGGPMPEFEFGDVDDLLGRFFGGARGGAAPRRRGADVEAELELDFLEAARGGEKKLTLALSQARGAVKSETVTVRIPAGVADGGRIRLPGKGGAGARGGPHGDLYATIRIRPHAVFRREGRDVVLDVPITVGEAIRGAKIEVPTLDGRATVAIPPGTDSGRRLRLRGKGIADPSGAAPGDLYVILQIRVPKGLDAGGLAHVEALAALEPADLREKLFE
jgi:curved DNA-binding protein